MGATALERLERATPVSAPLDPGFAIRRGASGLFELALWGRFYPGWSGSLANGLAQHDVSVVRGFARKVESLRWQARFELAPAHEGVNPLALDYLELAARPLVAGDRVPVSLQCYEVRASGAEGGSIRVRVEGPDQVGFLGTLLKRFAFLALFPEAMWIDTEADAVHDVFLLKGIGRTVPSDETRGALVRMLRRLEQGG